MNRARGKNIKVMTSEKPSNLGRYTYNLDHCVHRWIKNNSKTANCSASWFLNELMKQIMDRKIITVKLESADKKNA